MLYGDVFHECVYYTGINIDFLRKQDVRFLVFSTYVL